MDETHPALDPAHRPRELDRIAAQRIGRGGQARGLLGVGHHRLDLVQLARKPRGQTVRQQAEGGVAFATVPARSPARGLARVGTTNSCGQRSSLAARHAFNVLPAPSRSEARPWPGGRLGGPTPLSSDAEITATQLRRQAVTRWTRPADRAPSYGPCGQALEKLTLPHRAHTRRSRAHILTASTKTIHGKGNPAAPVGSRIAPSS